MAGEVGGQGVLATGYRVFAGDESFLKLTVVIADNCEPTEPLNCTL